MYSDQLFSIQFIAVCINFTVVIIASTVADIIRLHIHFMNKRKVTCVTKTVWTYIIIYTSSHCVYTL